MGFGILFFGYFITYMMSWNMLGVLIRILGYGIMAYGLFKLKSYQPDFLFSCIASAVLAGISALRGIGTLTQYLYDNLILTFVFPPDPLQTVLEVVDSALVLVFHALLLYAIMRIAKATELGKLAVSAVRNFIFIVIYYAVTLITMLFVKEAEMLSYMNLISFLLLFVWVVLDLILLFSCYARICDEGDVEMERKKSRFHFVNRFREELDARESKAIDEDRAYRAKKKSRRKK